jgi:hypothetical protein
MRAFTGLCITLLGLHASVASSLLVLPNLPRPNLFDQVRERFPISRPRFFVQLSLPTWMTSQSQSSSGQVGLGSSGRDNGSLVITDVIGTDRSINIFAGLIRDVNSVYSRVSDAQHNSTILSPANSAMNALPRKPWEDEAEYETFGAEAYTGQAGEDRAHRNLRFFVERHVILRSPWKENERAKTMGGGEHWWEMKDGKKIVSLLVGFVRKPLLTIHARFNQATLALFRKWRRGMDRYGLSLRLLGLRRLHE